jgi:hypothetical protein
LSLTPQPGQERSGEQRRRQFQAYNGQEVPRLANCRSLLPIAPQVHVASGWTGHQKHPVEGHHEKRADHHPVQGTFAVVMPDMDSARQADSGHGHHQGSQPHSVLVLEGKPHMHDAGGGHNPRA